MDQPVPPHSSARRAVAEAVVRTHAWADRCLSAHRRSGQALFGIIQGGLEADLRAESTRVIASMPFDGLCIGGLAGDETPAQRRAALDVCVPMLESDPRPRYLMGLGSPLDLLDAVDAGIDMFDSVMPARIARNGTVLVPDGRINLRNSRFMDDPAPVQDGCRCRACRSFSRAYLAHLLRADELLFYRLATLHNLTFLTDFMARIRAALAEGNFPRLVSEQAARVPSPANSMAGIQA
jgi:queuine tRNA-ribosyltransferase